MRRRAPILRGGTLRAGLPAIHISVCIWPSTRLAIDSLCHPGIAGRPGTGCEGRQDLYVLVDEDGITVRVDDHEAAGTLAHSYWRDASALQPPLQLTHFGELCERVVRAVPL